MRRPCPSRDARPALLALAALALLAAPAVAARPGRPGAQTHPGGQGAIAFESDRSGNSEIWRMEVDGHAPTQLTNDSASDIEPAWSGSGTQLAFVSLRDGNPEIFRMTATGAGVKQLTDTESVTNGEPAWFPDDDRVIFTSNRADPNSSDLWAQEVDANGNPVGAPVQLTTSSAFDAQASVSPDGKTIAFASNRVTPRNPTGDFEIFVMNADVPEGPNNKPQQLTNNDRADQHPDWSPNGKKLAFASDRGAPGAFLIYTMTSQGAKEQPLSPAGHVATEPTWSPDGKRLAYTGGDFTDDVLRINADGRQLTNLTGDSPGGNDSPAWQPR